MGSPGTNLSVKSFKKSVPGFVCPQNLSANLSAKIVHKIVQKSVPGLVCPQICPQNRSKKTLKPVGWPLAWPVGWPVGWPFARLLVGQTSGLAGAGHVGWLASGSGLASAFALNKSVRKIVQKRCPWLRVCAKFVRKFVRKNCPQKRTKKSVPGFVCAQIWFVTWLVDQLVGWLVG